MVRGKSEAVDAVIGELPRRNWVGFLIFGIDGFINMKRSVIAFPPISAVVSSVFWDKGCVVSFFIIDHKGAIHMRSHEKVLRTRQPFDL